MKTICQLLTVIAGLVTLVVPGRAATAGPAPEKDTIKAVIEEEKDAYHALDDARMAAVWIQQPTSLKFFVYDGKETHLDGYAAIAADARKALNRERALASAQRSRFEFSNYRITLQGDSAWVVCNARWDGVAQGWPASAAQSRVYVLQKEDGRWKLALMAISQLTFEKKNPPDQPAGTAQWSPEQLEALGVLQAAYEAEKRGDFEALPALFHQRFVAWDLGQTAPLDRAAHLEGEREFLKNYRLIEYSMTPVAIEIVGPIATVNVNYAHTLVAANGEKISGRGRWNATLVKEGPRWLFLSCTYSDVK